MTVETLDHFEDRTLLIVDDDEPFRTPVSPGDGKPGL